MTHHDHQLLTTAHAAAPGRGIRITANRGVWRKPDIHWTRFEAPATLAGFVGELDDQAVTVYRGDVCIRVLLGDIVLVTDDVGLTELSRDLTLEEALELAPPAVAA